MKIPSGSRVFLLSATALLCSAPVVGGNFPDHVPGTAKLELTQPLDVVMVDGIRRFAVRELDNSPSTRSRHWNRDFKNPVAYETSVEPNRQHLRTIIGAVDPRVVATA